MGGAVTYRRSRPGDRPQMLRVLALVGFEPIPCPEVPELVVEDFFVAEVDGAVVGVAGWEVKGDGVGKATLMAVEPGRRGSGIGLELQRLRLDELRAAGCRKVITNADRPETITWYQRHFGYRPVGTLAKLHPFGLPDVPEWTTLEAPLDAGDEGQA